MSYGLKGNQIIGC